MIAFIHQCECVDAMIEVVQDLMVMVLMSFSSIAYIV